jgi:hypothetical protein
MMRINVGSLRYSPSLSAWLIATEDHAKAEMLDDLGGSQVISPNVLLLAAADKRPSAKPPVRMSITLPRSHVWEWAR